MQPHAIGLRVAADGSHSGYPHRGEIWLVETPNQPDDPHQPRPALVVSENVQNRWSDGINVVPIFSAGQFGPMRVALRAGVTGLVHDSIVFCEEPSTLHRTFVIDEPLGDPVGPSVMARVNRAIRRALGEVVPEPS